MNTNDGRVGKPTGLSSTIEPASGLDASRFDPSRLSVEAIILAFGWFSFGAKATVTSNPPHANMTANKAALDELLAAQLITHEHETHKRYKIDRHHFRGTWEVMKLFQHPHAQAVLKAALASGEQS